MADQLSKLTKRADAVAESASVLVSLAIREIRGELSNLSRELNLAGNADDREGVYAMIRRKMNRLGRNLNRLLVAQNQAAAQGAAKAASDMTGLEIKYSAQRAKAICELVTPAQGENLAAVFTDKMGANMISTLREATVAALRQQAVAGGSMKELSRDMTERWFEAMKNEHPVFTDSAGHEWNTATYFQMNVRTNTMRVYNDCLVDNVARETGSDLMRISTGGDPSCAGCFPWEGCIISVSGKTKGFPTYEDARKGGCFHPNCVHTLQTVDEFFDADEIALQKAHPVDPDKADDADAQDERRYEIDQARKMRDEGLTAEQARVAVDRDNLAASIRHGLLRADAADMVAQMTDEQVTRLCPNGNPPEFVPAKGSKRKPEPEVWNHGSRGGVVHVKRDADLAHILTVTKADKAAPQKTKPVPLPVIPKPAQEPPKAKADPVEERRKQDVETLIGKADFKEITKINKRTGEEKKHRLTEEMVKSAFENADARMVSVYAKSVTGFTPTFDGSNCMATAISIGPGAWNGSPGTFCHECGHAVLNAHNAKCIKDGNFDKMVLTFNDKFKEDLTEYGKSLMGALKADAETFFDRVCGKRVERFKGGKWVESKTRAWHLLEDKVIIREVLGKEGTFMTTTREERHTYGAVMDILEAVTNAAYSGPVGHGASYYKQRGVHGRIHEPFANVSEIIALSGKDENYARALKVFPTFSKMVAKDFYGIDLQ